MDRYIHTHTLTRVAGLALPAVHTEAVEVVDLVLAAAPVLTRTPAALVHVWGGGATVGMVTHDAKTSPVTLIDGP